MIYITVTDIIFLLFIILPKIKEIRAKLLNLSRKQTDTQTRYTTSQYNGTWINFTLIPTFLGPTQPPCNYIVYTIKIVCHCTYYFHHGTHFPVGK